MDDHAVMLDGQHRILGLRIAVETGSAEIDVIRLPGERGIAHLDQRLKLRIDGAALVVFALAPEAVQELYLPAVLQIDSAVGPGLSASLRHEWQAELKVQSEILKGSLARDPVVKQVTVDELAAVPFVGTGAGKQHHGPRGRFHTQGRALAEHAAKGELFAVPSRGDQLAVGDLARRSVALDCGLAIHGPG